MNFAPFISIEGLILAAAFTALGIAIGGNNPEWVSARWRDMKKTAENLKDAEGRKQIAADTIAELKRQGLLKKD